MSSAGIRPYMVDMVFTLALFCFFALAGFTAAVAGSGAYKAGVEQIGSGHETSVALSYVTTRIRQNDAAGKLSLARIDGVKALLIEDIDGGAVYQTWIYHKDGALRELFTIKGNESAGPGTIVAEVGYFTFELMGDNLLKVVSGGGGGAEAEILISVRTALAR